MTRHSMFTVEAFLVQLELAPEDVLLERQVEMYDVRSPNLLDHPAEGEGVE